MKPADYDSYKHELTCLTKLKSFMETDPDFLNAPRLKEALNEF